MIFFSLEMALECQSSCFIVRQVKVVEMYLLENPYKLAKLTVSMEFMPSLDFISLLPMQEPKVSHDQGEYEAVQSGSRKCPKPWEFSSIYCERYRHCNSLPNATYQGCMIFNFELAEKNSNKNCDLKCDFKKAPYLIYQFVSLHNLTQFCEYMTIKLNNNNNCYHYYKL